MMHLPDKCSNAELKAQFERMPDYELILACQQQNKLAFDVLIRRHQKLIAHILYELAPDFSDRADLAQEVMIRIWRSVGSLKNRYAFRRWVQQMVRNLFYDRLRSMSKEPHLTLDETLDSDDNDKRTRLSEIADNERRPDQLAQRRELLCVINSAVDELPKEFHEALVLREFGGHSYNKIAAMTGSEIGTVKSRISRARQRIKAKMQYYLAS